MNFTLGQTPTFYPKNTEKMFEKCEFCEKSWKMRLWNCEFCEKWDFEIVNFVKNGTLKVWILWKMRLSKCEFCQKWDFEIVNFWINWWGFLPKCELTRAQGIDSRWNIGEQNQSVNNA